MSLPTEESSAKAVWAQLRHITAKGHSPDKVFHDWLDLTLYAMQRRNSEYLEIMGEYSNTEAIGKRPADYFASALGELMCQMQQHCTDVLGYIFTAEITRGENGQFFTPSNVCELMAAMSCAKLTQKKLRYADPCCGSGRMLIAMQKRMPNGWYFATDIDARCAKMTALNMLFRNAAGIVVHGDSLSLEVWRAWETTNSYMGGSIRELSAEELPAIKEMQENMLKQSMRERQKHKTVSKSRQLVLF